MSWCRRSGDTAARRTRAGSRVARIRLALRAASRGSVICAASAACCPSGRHEPSPEPLRRLPRRRRPTARRRSGRGDPDLIAAAAIPESLDDDEPVDLTGCHAAGTRCNRRGKMVTLIIHAADAGAIYSTVMGLARDGDPRRSARQPEHALAAEGLHAGARARRRGGSLIGSALRVLRDAATAARARAADHQLRPESLSRGGRDEYDFCKHIETLCFVIDCALDRIDPIKAYLEQGVARGFRGIDVSDTALMTCLVTRPPTPACALRRRRRRHEGTRRGSWRASSCSRAPREGKTASGRRVTGGRAPVRNLPTAARRPAPGRIARLVPAVSIGRAHDMFRLSRCRPPRRAVDSRIARRCGRTGGRLKVDNLELIGAQRQRTLCECSITCKPLCRSNDDDRQDERLARALGAYSGARYGRVRQLAARDHFGGRFDELDLVLPEHPAGRLEPRDAVAASTRTTPEAVDRDQPVRLPHRGRSAVDGEWVRRMARRDRGRVRLRTPRRGRG